MTQNHSSNQITVSNNWHIHHLKTIINTQQQQSRSLVQNGSQLMQSSPKFDFLSVSRKSSDIWHRIAYGQSKGNNLDSARWLWLNIPCKSKNDKLDLGLIEPMDRTDFRIFSHPAFQRNFLSTYISVTKLSPHTVISPLICCLQKSNVQNYQAYNTVICITWNLMKL